MDGAESLFDWDSGDVSGSDVFDIVKAGVKGFGMLQDSQDKEQKTRMNSWDFTQRGTESTKGGEYNPGNPRKIPWGLPDYSADPNAIEAFWNQTLRKLVDVKETKVSKSK